MMCRVSAFAFDVAGTAGWYSSIAGLLTGFALLAILFPLDHEAEREDVDSSNAIVVFTCAFFALLVLAMNYAVLAGRAGGGDVSGIAAHEQMLFGPAFGLATLLLLFGLNAVLRTYGTNRQVFRPARYLILQITSFLGPILVIAMQFSNALDLQYFRVAKDPEAARCSVAGLPDALWASLSIMLLTVVGLVVVAALGRRLNIPQGAPIVIAKIVLGFTMVVTVWSAVVVPLLPISVVTGVAMERVALILAGIATLAMSAAAQAGRER